MLTVSVAGVQDRLAEFIVTPDTVTGPGGVGEPGASAVAAWGSVSNPTTKPAALSPARPRRPAGRPVRLINVPSGTAVIGQAGAAAGSLRLTCRSAGRSCP